MSVMVEKLVVKKRKNKKLLKSKLLQAMVYGAGIVTLGILLWMVIYILMKGIPYISKDLFAWVYTSENVSLMPALINTCLLIGGVLVIAVPIGIASAIYLQEYVQTENPLVVWIRRTTETLAAIPSIVYGLFGSLFFVSALQMGNSLLAGIFTLSMMVLPLVIQSTQNALKEVSNSYREASFALGAGKLRTILRIVLPNAMNGILAGIILSIGRIVSESAALIYTAGTVNVVAKNLFSSTRTLSVHMYVLSSEGLHTNQAYATAVVLLIVVLVINVVSTGIGRKLEKR